MSGIQLKDGLMNAVLVQLAFFGILNVAGFFFCLFYLPETKGKTLEQMNDVWKKEFKQ